MPRNDIEAGYRGFPDSERIRRIENRERWKVNPGDPNGVVTAGVSVYCWDRTNDDLYVNTDGATNWQFIGGSSGVIGSGVATRVAFWSAANTLSSNSNLYWDNGNSRLGIGTATPDRQLHTEISDAVTNTTSYVERATHTTSGTAASFFGVGKEWELEDATGVNRIASVDETVWISAAAGTYSAARAFYAASNAASLLFFFITGSTTQAQFRVNPLKADIDFRVDDDTNDYAILVQASSGYTGFGTQTPSTRVEIEEDKVLGSSPTDDYAACLTSDPAYTGAFTVTRHNYWDVNDIGLAGGAAVTDACIMRFDANAGVHKAVDSGTTKTTPGTVNAWIKANVNGTIHYIPTYTSKTS